jgi:DNA-binding CsgD family transcriptional regulator
VNAKNFPKTSLNERQEKAALLLAMGQTIDEAAKELGVSEKTIDNWKREVEFKTRLDEVSLTVGVALKAERLRMANRIARKLASKKTPTRKDLLEWLKFAQSETDGNKVNVNANVNTTAVNFYIPENGRGDAPAENDE